MIACWDPYKSKCVYAWETCLFDPVNIPVWLTSDVVRCSQFMWALFTCMAPHLPIGKAMELIGMNYHPVAASRRSLIAWNKAVHGAMIGLHMGNMPQNCFISRHRQKKKKNITLFENN